VDQRAAIAGSTPAALASGTPSTPTERDLNRIYGLTGPELTLLATELTQGLTAQTVERYRLGAQAAEYAELSQAVYELRQSVDVDRDGQDDWRIARSMTDGPSGFKGAVYVHVRQRRVVVAFAGTKIQASYGVADYVNDVVGAGDSDLQIPHAQELASDALTTYRSGYSIHVTGHSLGGRLAQFVAAKNGLDAFTFHSAAVSQPDYVTIASRKAIGITNVITPHDVVFQLSTGRGAVHSGRRLCFDFGDRGFVFANHSIEPLVASLNGVKRVFDERIAPQIRVQQADSGAPSQLHPAPEGKKRDYVGAADPKNAPPTSTGVPAASQNSPGKAGSSHGFSGAEILTLLGTTKEQDRLSAITQLARQDKIRGPLTPDEVASILKGCTGGHRAQAISELATFIKPRLAASEAAIILGTPAELQEQSRLYAVQALSRRNRLGDLGSDASLLLTGTTGGNRAQSIAEMVAFFRTGLSAEEVADAFGDPKHLQEQSRLYALQALARANKLSGWGADAASPLAGTTHGNRAQAIAEIARSIKTGLSADDTGQLLGNTNDLNQQDRLYAIHALAAANKLAPWAADAAKPLSGTSGGHRAQAIAAIAASLRNNLTGSEAAVILGNAEVLNEHDRLYAIHALTRAKKLKQPLSGDEVAMILVGTSGGNRVQALAELTHPR
jgi:hypothetical protein